LGFGSAVFKPFQILKMFDDSHTHEEGRSMNQKTTPAHEAAVKRGEHLAMQLSDEMLAASLEEYADDIELDTGRSYAPAFMREAAKRLRLAKSGAYGTLQELGRIPR
jgi:hypothetical protein